MIETGLNSGWGHNDFIPYDLAFPGTPRAITCAQFGGEPKMTCPVNIASDGFLLASMNHDGNPVSSAWTFFIAVYPSEYMGQPDPDPSICLDPASLTNACPAGQNAPSQSFDVWNCGGGTLTYTIHCEGTGGGGAWQNYGQRYAIIVMGGNVPHGSQHYQWYWGDTYGMYTELESYGFTAENVHFLSYGPEADAHPEAVDGISTTANIQAAYQWVQQVCTADDLLYIYWVDHGSTTSFQTNDGNITHAALGTLMQPIVAKQILGAYNPCYSGAVIDDISRPGVITTTSQDAAHPNSWGWAGKWRHALRGGTPEDPTDTNEDGYISMTEAYLWICPKSQAGGEHPMYDDNGDGVGHECTDAGFDPDDPTKDGYVGKSYSLDGWYDAEGADWLSCDPTSGESTGETDTIQVNYETAALSAGTYTATIVVTAAGADNSPQTIVVDLTVLCLGDSNCDGLITWRDIDFFVAAQNDNVAAWEAMFLPGTPSCSFANNNVNADGTVNWRDIDPFVALMNTTCP
ncbi:MAG: hypothetical protein KAY37_03100 [Phycisphaerae bacterium]|nr:hypothetical protein [Phycisphaerae bacterium]